MTQLGDINAKLVGKTVAMLGELGGKTTHTEKYTQQGCHPFYEDIITNHHCCLVSYIAAVRLVILCRRLQSTVMAYICGANLIKRTIIVHYSCCTGAYTSELPLSYHPQ